jgi:quinol monooxygenase YgiN
MTREAKLMGLLYATTRIWWCGKNDDKLGTLAHTPGMRVALTSFFTSHGDMDMLTKSLFVRLEAKPGKEAELAAFLQQGLQLAQAEVTTPVWFALRVGPSTFGIFDAFRDETGRQAHLDGPIAKALMAQAPNLLATAPVIERLDVIGAKVVG